MEKELEVAIDSIKSEHVHHVIQKAVWERDRLITRLRVELFLSIPSSSMFTLAEIARATGETKTDIERVLKALADEVEGQPANPRDIMVSKDKLRYGFRGTPTKHAQQVEAPTKRKTVTERVRDFLLLEPAPHTVAEIIAKTGVSDSSVREVLRQLLQSKLVTQIDGPYKNSPYEYKSLDLNSGEQDGDGQTTN